MRTAATDATGWRPGAQLHPQRSAEQALEQLPDPFGAVDDQVGGVQQLGRGLGRADRHPQAAAGSAATAKAGRSPRSSPATTRAAGARLGRDPADGVALVAVHLGAQLPDQPAGHDLEVVAGATRAAAWPIGPAQRPGSATRRVWTATA